MKSLLMNTWIFLAFSFMVEQIVAFKCTLPNGCSIKPLKYKINTNGIEKKTYKYEFKVIKCYPKIESFQFKFIENDYMKTMVNKSQQLCGDHINYEYIIFQWPNSEKKKIILDNNFNITNMIRYMEYFNKLFLVYFINMKGIEINLSDNNKSSSIIENNQNILLINCLACKMNFYTNGKSIKSCRDILESNSTILSIFQMNSNTILIQNSENSVDLCPLIFKNANIAILSFLGLADTFYKKNLLKFTNDVFSDLNSSIKILELDKVESIKLDLTFLHPSIYSRLRRINIYGPIKSIDKNIFAMIPQLDNIYFDSIYFRKMIHENGIDWLKEMNKNVTKVDLKNISEANEIIKHRVIIRGIYIYCNDASSISEPLFQVLPEEDFCLYKDFPFERLVILLQVCDNKFLNEMIKTEEFTCTYWWLIQYIEFHYEIFNKELAVSQTIKKIINTL